MMRLIIVRDYFLDIGGVISSTRSAEKELNSLHREFYLTIESRKGD